MYMQIVRRLDEDGWKAFVDHHPRGNIFHTPEMHQVFAKTRKHRPEVWAALNDRAEIAALMTPVQVTLMNSVLRRLTTRSVVYGGALCHDAPEGRAALRQLLEAYAEHAQRESLFTELRNLRDVSELQPILTGAGYAYEEHLNYLIDLNRPLAAVLQSIGPRTRKKIRKGLRDGRVRVREVSDRADLAHWHTTLQKTYESAHVPLADPSLFEAAFEVLYPKGMAVFLLAEIAGIAVACSVELPYKDTIYGWYGGCDRAYSECLPNELLIWHILEWGASHGYRVYDFGGAGKPGETYGVRDFKAKFGGELVCYGRNICKHTPGLLRLSQWGYSVYRKLVWPPARPTVRTQPQGN
ncbi:MAG TPA: GNAT family N-acetyltransferase [Anaerolineae bacterium]|nr:GNAT family N-acetyltransferase [Anaerolineae bacterium]